MTNTDKPYITPTRETAESPDESTYIVAVNDQGQHAVWPAELALPAGWRRQSAAMPRRACLADISSAGPVGQSAGAPSAGNGRRPGDLGRSLPRARHRGDPLPARDLEGGRCVPAAGSGAASRASQPDVRGSPPQGHHGEPRGGRGV